MFLAPHEPPVVGKSAIRTWLNQFFSQIAMTKVEMVERHYLGCRPQVLII